MLGTEGYTLGSLVNNTQQATTACSVVSFKLTLAMLLLHCKIFTSNTSHKFNKGISLQCHNVHLYT